MQRWKSNATEKGRKKQWKTTGLLSHITPESVCLFYTIYKYFDTGLTLSMNNQTKLVGMHFLIKSFLLNQYQTYH